MLVKVTLARLLIREMADSQFVTLQEEEGERMFPIAIGLPEAFAIERRLRKAAVPRPQTHDLLENTISLLGGDLVQIVIHALEEGTFFAKIVVRQNDDLIEIDLRLRQHPGHHPVDLQFDESRMFRRGANRVIVDIQTEGDVLSNGPTEEHGLLRHHADLPAEFGQASKLSPNPSPSVSYHWEGSLGNASANPSG